LAGLSYAIAQGPEIIETERGGDYGRVMLADRLLPKLIGGELRVPDAERIVRRVV
jgi:hypothetical protein